MRIVLTNSDSVAVENGKPFPDWSDVMTVRDIDGKAISIGDYKGKVVLIDFWATWCGPCIAEMPNVVKLYKEAHEKGFEVIGISFDGEGKENEQKLRDTIAGKGKIGVRTGVMPWRQIYDGGGWGSGMAKRYGIRSIPSTVLIDKEGKVVAAGLRGPDLEKKVKEMLGIEVETPEPDDDMDDSDDGDDDEGGDDK